ncbi:MAG: hypothetical protein KME23_11040 [Goleter apudmare HA4340-LM2]|jgi:hypothetical protein|nr:hypothetical protein [Goleter apudmare HA4340-LM2]
MTISAARREIGTNLSLLFFLYNPNPFKGKANTNPFKASPIDAIYRHAPKVSFVRSLQQKIPFEN